MSLAILQMETMSAAKKIGEALLVRGFLLKVEEDTIVLSSGNGMNDVRDVRMILEREGVPAMYDGNRIQILAPDVPRSIITKIIRKPAIRQNYYIPGYFDSWKSFTRRNHGLRYNTLVFDPGVALLIKSMSEAGLLVTGGCDGHRRKAPLIWFASSWNGAWFSVIFDNLLVDLPLHYDWSVVFSPNGGAEFRAFSNQDQTWDIKKIQHDTCTMALKIREHASELREIKRKIFKHRSMKEQALQLANNSEALIRWVGDLFNSRNEI